MNELILASGSPRRRELLEGVGFSFEVCVQPVNEDIPENIKPEDSAKYLADYKNSEYRKLLSDQVIITADTVVVSGGKILGKPSDKDNALQMLQNLSNKKHKVVSAVTISSNTLIRSFDDTTLVSFGKLSNQEIEHYIGHYEPFDKAGSYGIQEWIGMIGVNRIEGSYYNVMGMPIHKVYKCLTMDFGIFPEGINQ